MLLLNKRNDVDKALFKHEYTIAKVVSDVVLSAFAGLREGAASLDGHDLARRQPAEREMLGHVLPPSEIDRERLLVVVTCLESYQEGEHIYIYIYTQRSPRSHQIGPVLFPFSVF